MTYPSLEPANTTNVFVKNISTKVTTEMLADFFSYCGTVSKISVFKLKIKKNNNNFFKGGKMTLKWPLFTLKKKNQVQRLFCCQV